MKGGNNWRVEIAYRFDSSLAEREVEEHPSQISKQFSIQGRKRLLNRCAVAVQKEK